ncbi:hypothetical protein [Sphingobium amiense]|uniref:hypothetical protein n=1 Tax=Sphingobium amiense TaxID=135719 RepID=UPI000F81A2F8|nr:hypothetical protein [Sphingobium amiense]
MRIKVGWFVRIFTLVSMIYWFGVLGLWMMIVSAYRGSAGTFPPVDVGSVAIIIPTLIYAVLCWLFCRYLGNSIAKQVMRQVKDR